MPSCWYCQRLESVLEKSFAVQKESIAGGSNAPSLQFRDAGTPVVPVVTFSFKSL